MRLSLASGPGAKRMPRAGERGGARPIVLLLVGCLFGMAVSALLFYAASRRGSGNATGQANTPAIRLSDSTKAVLGRLDSPLEIRFYAVLDPATVPEASIAFAGQVGRLLSAYQQEASGKIKVTSVNSPSNPNERAAMADGISAFNTDKGDTCYLGIALALNGRKETLPRLSPDWEQVLEPDLTRAIIRLIEAARPIPLPTAVARINTNAVQEVKTLIPDVAAVSVQQGKEILQDAALKDFTAAAKEMQAQIKEAEQRLTQAQNGGTDAEQQAAVKHLKQVQAEQTEKLKQITARSKAQIDAFQQLKTAPH